MIEHHRGMFAWKLERRGYRINGCARGLGLLQDVDEPVGVGEYSVKDALHRLAIHGGLRLRAAGLHTGVRLIGRTSYLTRTRLDVLAGRIRSRPGQMARRGDRRWPCDLNPGGSVTLADQRRSSRGHRPACPMASRRQPARQRSPDTRRRSRTHSDRHGLDDDVATTEASITSCAPAVGRAREPAGRARQARTAARRAVARA